MLARGVDRGPGGSFMTVGRGDVDNTAGSLRSHHPDFMLQAENDSEHVRVECGRIAFGRLIRDRAGFPFGACMVDRDVQPAKALDGAIDELTNIFLLTNVGANEFSFRTELP